jgi:rare lipoprotein A (peptidoglycan hydrolase)
MSNRVKLTAAVAVLASAATPSLCWAAGGGAGLGGGNRSGAEVRPGNVTVTSSVSGLTLSTRASALLRKAATFTGGAPRSDAGKTLVIQRLGHETGWSWETTVSATIERNGDFSAVWHTNHIGRFSIRLVLTTAGRQPTNVPSKAGGVAASASPTVTMTVYRPSLATMYGPGFWGERTACGERLRRSTIGLANKTLRCGENVALYYAGHTLIVPVIDRGPYAHRAEWDLTEATDKALGIPGTAEIGAVSLPNPPHGQ